MELKHMKSKKADPAVQRKKKFLLMLPVLVFPFITGVFWALGGGKGTPGKVEQKSVQRGLNMNLPQPHFDKKATVLDKLGFYQKAAMDSAKLVEKRKTDPYLFNKPVATRQKGAWNLTGGLDQEVGHRVSSPQYMTGTYADPNEEKVYKKLDQLKKIINQPSTGPVTAGRGDVYRASYQTPALPASPDIDRLEKLVQTIKHPIDSTGKDPQMDRINVLLDKVLKIQHPEMVTITENKHAPDTRLATPPKLPQQDTNAVSVLGSDQPVADTGGTAAVSTESDGFIAFDDNSGSDEPGENTIRAVISEDQTLVSGATIKLRLTEDAHVNGVILPRDNFVYGTATLNNERLLISIKSVINDHSIYPVNWQVFDLDGMAGIFIPGAISRDVSKESAAEGVNSMGITSLDASLGAQAANAGIETVKTLFSKKVKLVRVTVKAGYEVLLKESKTAS